MTKDEFDAWTRHTDRSRRGWQRDEVTLRYRGVYLLYHGGTDGTFVKIDGSTVTVGKYEGASPICGEARFRATGQRTFRDAPEAWRAVAGATGVRGLLALLGIPEMCSG